MNHETITAINAWASEIEKQVVAVAPKVWATALAVKRADCLGEIIVALISIIVWCVILTILCKQAKKHWALAAEFDAEKLGDSPGAWEHVAALLFVAASVAGFAIIVASSMTLFDQWTWIGAVNPGLAVAHDIIVKAMSQ